MGENKNAVDQIGQGQLRREPPELSDDRLYRALSSKRRRRLLYVLLVEESSSMERIATVLVRWTVSGKEEMVRPEERERILTELDHIHLPVLEEAGMVSYDREDGTVRIAPLDVAVTDLIAKSVETESSSQS
jgi:DNA-binding transcriptional ArsR family regulator